MEKEIQVLGEAQNQPHDTETEHAVLATLMRHNEKFDEFSDLLSADLFYHPVEKVIFRCIEGVIDEGGITDINSLEDYRQRNNLTNAAYMTRIDFLNIFQKASTQTLEQDIRRLRMLSKKRLAWILLQQAAINVVDLTKDLDEELNAVITSLGEVQAETSEDGIVDFDHALQELQEIVDDNANGRKISLHTGFKIFDDYFLLRPNTLTVIAAFTSVGKSALAMNITLSVAQQQVPCAYYSLEMGKAELASRGISKDVGIPASIIMNKQLSVFQKRSFDDAVNARKSLPIYFDDRSTVAFDKTIRSIRTMVRTRNIRLAVIDYLQIYAQVSDNTEASLAYMARAAKNVAKECGIAVILLSQLNRSGAHPSIKMLRGSGQIEESADNIVLIDRPEAYPDNNVTKYEGEFKDESTSGTAKFILSKGRGVGTGCSLVGFNSMYTQFYELAGSKPFEQPAESKEEVPF